MPNLPVLKCIAYNERMKIDNTSILVTGGTGSFGHKFVAHLLNHYQPHKLVIYSRDEYKHYLMQEKFKQYGSRLRFLIGDVRDRNRLYRAFDGIETVVHAAALKHVPLMEYNPIEAVRTNIEGAENIIDAALDRGVKRVIALSTDKAVNPVNLYGATKLVSDKLFVAANSYAGNKQTRFSVVRYGNVAGSRGSVVPLFKRLIDGGATELPLTDSRMTRFWISLEQAVVQVVKAIGESSGGEIYVSKIPSFKITDLAEAMLPGATFNIVGIRPGEKLHEAMITEADSPHTYEYERDYLIYPAFNWWNNTLSPLPGGTKVAEGFHYISNENTEWLSVEQLREILTTLDIVI